jgi:hypothetical protein
MAMLAMTTSNSIKVKAEPVAEAIAFHDCSRNYASLDLTSIVQSDDGQQVSNQPLG